MKKVAISCRITEAAAYSEVRNSLALDWIRLFEKLGILPVLVPNGLNEVGSYLEGLKVDAVILSGGNNVSPKLYGSSESLTDVYKIRDVTESEIIDYCANANIPLVGICRGMSMINVHFGGRLSHDIIGHVGTPHIVNINRDIGFSSQCMTVNSYHRHGISREDLADVFSIFAESQDHYVEGIIHKKLNIFGFQWHPERNLCDEETLRVLNNMLFGSLQ